jgi:hypothetical protein
MIAGWRPIGVLIVGILTLLGTQACIPLSLALAARVG